MDAANPVPAATSPTPSTPGWFRQRSYAHFDSIATEDVAFRYASDPIVVAKHAFWPLIKFEKRTIRYRRNESTGIRHFERVKTRQLMYCAHFDSYIMSKYACDLSLKLESSYSNEVSECVLAYRKFPVKKSNIHFALDAFKRIKNYGECVVLCIDVQNFFGTLQHKVLKKQWIQLLSCESGLPADHYALFKAITKFRSIDRNKLRLILKRDIPKRRSAVADRICSPNEFRSIVRYNIDKNAVEFGIPQGTPISATLSNVYMRSFDETICQMATRSGGIYRRYSDDILFICRETDFAESSNRIRQELENIGLTLQDEKTLVVQFAKTESHLRAYKYPCGDSKLTDDGKTPTTLQYLGFNFDGQCISIRPTSIARFLRKLTRGVKSAYYAAKGNGTTKIRRRKLFNRFSRRGKIFINKKGERVKSKYERNFLTYGKHAFKIVGDSTIQRQLGILWNRLNKEIKKREQILVRESR
jgi:RNA-directed DNA polymerase